jgi:hypothetical protein
MSFSRHHQVRHPGQQTRHLAAAYPWPNQYILFPWFDPHI